MYRDGTAGTWVRSAPGPNNTFPVTITQSKGGVAYVMLTGTQYSTMAFLGSLAEIQAQGAAICQNQTQTVKTLSGFAVGLDATDLATINVGGAAASVQGSGNGSFSLTNVANGTTDLVATRSALNMQTFSYTLINMVLRRNVNYAAGTAISPSISLANNSSEAFVPVMRNVTLAGLGSDQAFVLSQYYTANGVSASLFQETTPNTSTAHNFFTLPASRQVAGDYHYLAALAAPNFSTAPTVQRFVGMAFAASADKTLTFGAQPTAVTPSTLSTSAPVRQRAAFATQSDYNRLYQATWSQSLRTITVQMTSAYVGTVASLNIDIDDYTPAGFLATYGLQPLVSTTLSTVRIGWTATGGITGSPFVEGAVYQYALGYLTFTL